MTDELIPLPAEDFRRLRDRLSPEVYLWIENGDVVDAPLDCAEPSDLIEVDDWKGIMDLPTDVALITSGSDGSLVSGLHEMEWGWIESWPASDADPFAGQVALTVSEEFDALVFNALHGYYRQAIACLRNALELMTITASFAAHNDAVGFSRWISGDDEISFQKAKKRLENSDAGERVAALAEPLLILRSNDSWLSGRYRELCNFSHGRARYNNGDLWQSNGPVYVHEALARVEREFRETQALCYVLLKLSWSDYIPGVGPCRVVDGPMYGWEKYRGFLRAWLTS